MNMNNRRIAKILPAAAALLLLAAVLHAAAVLRSNAGLREQFARNTEPWLTRGEDANFGYERLQYHAGTPVHAMDVSRFRIYEVPQAAVEDVYRTIRLPVPVSYYRLPGDRIPALEIPVETKVYVIAARHYGYGCAGLPTDRRGWHYAVPFVPAEAMDKSAFQTMAETALPAQEMYYVRTRDLLAAAETVYRETAALAAGKDGWTAETAALETLNRFVFSEGVSTGHLAVQPASGTDADNTGAPKPAAAAAFLRRSGVRATLEEQSGTYPKLRAFSDAKSYAYTIVYLCDILFEDSCIQLCPDFYAPVFDGWTVGLLTASAACLAAHIALRARAKKRLRNGGGPHSSK